MRDENQDYEKNESNQVKNKEVKCTKKRYWKLILYILQILLIMYIISKIIDPILAAIIGVLMGTIITMVSTIFERIKKEEKVKIQDIINFTTTFLKGFPILRDLPIDLNKFIKSPDERSKVRKTKKYLYLVDQLIRVKNLGRSGKYSKDKMIKEFEEIKEEAEENKFMDLLDETQFFLTYIQ